MNEENVIAITEALDDPDFNEFLEEIINKNMVIPGSILAMIYVSVNPEIENYKTRRMEAVKTIHTLMIKYIQIHESYSEIFPMDVEITRESLLEEFKGVMRNYFDIPKTQKDEAMFHESCKCFVEEFEELIASLTKAEIITSER